MNESNISRVIKENMEVSDYLVLEEFGIWTEVDTKHVDLVPVRWRTHSEIQCLAIECKCEATARDSLFEALEQAVQYQPFFPDVVIGTQQGNTFADEEVILRKLGLGRIMVGEAGDFTPSIVPSASENTLFNKERFDSQVKGRAILFLTFCEVFPNVYSRHWWGGTKEGELWVYDRPKNEVQLRGWTMINRDSYFEINVESVSAIRSIMNKIDVKKLSDALSRLPEECEVDLSERATTKDSRGLRILDRQEGSINIEGSIFDEKRVPAKELTAKLIKEEIVERSRELEWWTHLNIDIKLWRREDQLTKRQYLARMQEVNESLIEVCDLLRSWV